MALLAFGFEAMASDDICGYPWIAIGMVGFGLLVISHPHFRRPNITINVHHREQLKLHCATFSLMPWTIMTGMLDVGDLASLRHDSVTFRGLNTR